MFPSNEDDDGNNNVIVVVVVIMMRVRLSKILIKNKKKIQRIGIQADERPRIPPRNSPDQRRPTRSAKIPESGQEETREQGNHERHLEGREPVRGQ